MYNLRTYLYELSNLYFRTVKRYVHAFEILPGGRYISGSTYQNIAKWPIRALVSWEFVGQAGPTRT